MALYLVQHGISQHKDIDPERHLSPKGRAEVEKIAEAAKKYAITPACITHSGKTRARQTAEIFAENLHPPNGLLDSNGLAPIDDVTELGSTLSTEDNLMLVGHLPFMERLVSYLITGKTEPPVIRFQNGGIICLDQEKDSAAWYISWTLLPRIH